MKRRTRFFLLITLLGVFTTGLASLAKKAPTQEEHPPAANKAATTDDPTIIDNSPTTLAEARARARMLHEAFHGALQVMHRDFFDEDERDSLPVVSLEDVFEEMASRQNVKLKWISVNTKAMSINHRPDSDFEHAAVKALSSGKSEFEAVENDTFQYAGTVRLAAHCLKCHKPGRTSNEARSAGLVITMPLKKQ